MQYTPVCIDLTNHNKSLATDVYVYFFLYCMVHITNILCFSSVLYLFYLNLICIVSELYLYPISVPSAPYHPIRTLSILSYFICFPFLALVY